jgi:uncharacterized protein YyaL (SSP411 family)
MRRVTFALLGTVFMGALAQARSPAAEPPANRLARETSPYLRQHAHNPVDWHPWGPEAFAKARKEDKLIFLSVGYSSCHWCHVMERESFSNPNVAKLLNGSFVCIKVDREERPDVDQVYQTAAQILLQGQPGGWPLSVFLTPDGKPIAATGIFLPPDDRTVDGQRLPGLKSLIRGVLEVRRDHPKEVREQADQVARVASLSLGRTARAEGPEPRRYHVTAAVDALKEEFDAEYGGFGNPRASFRGSKFPMTPALGLLFQVSGRTMSVSELSGGEFLGMVTRTLDHMAQGGIYDQLGGGFHRYSTDRGWTTPHFEKMLPDNAQLAELYARAYERTKNPIYRRVVEETLEFVRRELTAPDGGFYSALDADSEGEEGRYYLWSAREMDAALPDRGEAELAGDFFGLGGIRMLDGKQFVLTRPDAKEPPGDRYLAVRQKLFVARSKRARPLLDTKIVTAWNGQMIAAYAVSGRVLGQPTYTAAAVRAADFILNHLRTIDGRLLRSYAAAPDEPPKATIVAYLDDYAFLVDGLLTLQVATGDARWLAEARALTELMTRYYGDENGGFFLTASDQDKLFARAKPMTDAAQPCANAVAVRNLLRLAAMTGEVRYRDVAGRTLRAFTADLEQTPVNMPAMAAVVDEYLAAAPQQPGGQPASRQPAGGAPKRSEAVVKVTATADKPSADGKQTVTVTLAIDKDWHTYANPVGNSDLESARTTVTVDGKAKPRGVKVEYPKGKKVKDPLVGDYQVYEGNIEIKAVVERAAGDTGPLDVTVKLQACNDKMCLPPATVKLTAP